MPKHNNAIPRNHFRKHFFPEASQKGHIKTFFHQAKQKQARRVRRQQKAKNVFPKPAGGLLRPVVQSCTARYNMKSRAGRGFTLAEVKAAGLCPRYARTIGIAVDQRRRNHSEESLSANTLRLKEYMSKLVLFPLKGGKKNQGPIAVASAEQLKAVQQDKSPMPLAGFRASASAEAPREVSKDEKTRNIYNFLRAQLRNEKFVGIRLARTKRAEAKKAKEAAEGKKK